MEEQMMDWEEVPVSSQRNELLIPAIERLPEQSRKVLQMSYWEEKKNAVLLKDRGRNTVRSKSYHRRPEFSGSRRPSAK